MRWFRFCAGIILGCTTGVADKGLNAGKARLFVYAKGEYRDAAGKTYQLPFARMYRPPCGQPRNLSGQKDSGALLHSLGQLIAPEQEAERVSILACQSALAHDPRAPGDTARQSKTDSWAVHKAQVSGRDGKVMPFQPRPQQQRVLEMISRRRAQAHRDPEGAPTRVLNAPGRHLHRLAFARRLANSSRSSIARRRTPGRNFATSSPWLDPPIAAGLRIGRTPTRQSKGVPLG